jgi:hypothetical protein
LTALELGKKQHQQYRSSQVLVYPYLENAFSDFSKTDTQQQQHRHSELALENAFSVSSAFSKKQRARHSGAVVLSTGILL